VSGSKKEFKSRLREFCMKRGAVTFGVSQVSDVDSLPNIRLAPMMKYIMDTKPDYTRGPTEAILHSAIRLLRKETLRVKGDIFDAGGYSSSLEDLLRFQGGM
jgi:hypothetical protein